MSEKFSGNSFLDMYCSGRALAEQIDDHIELWHTIYKNVDPDLVIPLHEFLGFSWDEYKLWMSDEDILPLIATAKKTGCSYESLVEERVDGIAARADNKTAAALLRVWLKERRQNQ